MELKNNTLYKASYSIIVEAADHRLCIDTYNRFKYLVKAFNTPFLGQFYISEWKSTRKGDVLKRELQIYHTSYVDNILLFRAALDYIVQDYHYSDSQVYPIKVGLYKATVIPEKMTFEILE